MPVQAAGLTPKSRIFAKKLRNQHYSFTTPRRKLLAYAPVSEVIEEINRYRPGRVILTNPNLGRERFSARFRLANINGLVDKIAQVFDVRTTVLPAGIVLLS